MGETANFGFKKLPDGYFVTARILNGILDEIDEKLYTAMQSDKMSEGGIATSVNWGAASADWDNLIPLDDASSIQFASAGDLSKLRVIVPSAGAPSSGTLTISIARASVPLTPLTPVVSVITGGVDAVVVPVATTAIAADEELVLILNNSATGVGTGGTIEITVELNVPVS